MGNGHGSHRQHSSHRRHSRRRKSQAQVDVNPLYGGDNKDALKNYFEPVDKWEEETDESSSNEGGEERKAAKKVEIKQPNSEDSEKKSESSEIENHANLKKSKVTFVEGDIDTAAEFMAMKEAEERKKKEEEDKNKSYECLVCRQMIPHSNYYELDVCGHGYCTDCVYLHAEAQLRDIDKQKFIKCPLESCNSQVSTADLREALRAFGNPDIVLSDNIGSEKAVFLTHSLRLFIENNPDYVCCPNEQCGNVFERLPPTEHELQQTVRDDHGIPLTGLPLQHYHTNRFRCRECDAIFCCLCKSIPYHVGYDCESYQQYLKADKLCHFCNTTLPEKHPPFKRKVPDASGEGVSPPPEEKKKRSKSFFKREKKEEENPAGAPKKKKFLFAKKLNVSKSLMLPVFLS